MKCALRRFWFRMGKSLPVRGAWIEMVNNHCLYHRASCRSPCGERGLKSTIHGVSEKQVEVAPRAGSVG